MGKRIPWKTIAIRLSEECAVQQGLGLASLGEQEEIAQEFLIEAVEWWQEQTKGAT